MTFDQFAGKEESPSNCCPSSQRGDRLLETLCRSSEARGQGGIQGDDERCGGFLQRSNRSGRTGLRHGSCHDEHSPKPAEDDQLAFKPSKENARRESVGSSLMTKGWLLDCYPSLSGEGGMTFWIKAENGENIRLKDSNWRAKIYASGPACDSPEFLFSKLKASGFVSAVNVVKKRTRISDWKRSDALEIELRQPDKGKKVADLLESIFQNPSTFTLYNVDVSPEQQYFLEKDLFPLAHVGVYSNGGEITKWRMLDSVEATDYEIPRLKVMGLSINLADQVPRMDSRLASIKLTPSIYHDETEADPIEIQGDDEGKILLETAKEVQRFDPDFIITSNGDAFVFPYLYSKAQKHQVSFDLNRDPDAQQRVSHNTQSGGRTYFSYGRMMDRPTTQRFFGRIHVDGQNTFVYDQCRFEGLFEISRISRMPFHTSSRASIGKSLSGLQFYCAHLRDTLIPYKPVTSEDIKSMEDLMTTAIRVLLLYVLR